MDKPSETVATKDAPRTLPAVKIDPKSWGTVVGIWVRENGEVVVRSNNEGMMVLVWGDDGRTEMPESMKSLPFEVYTA